MFLPETMGLMYQCCVWPNQGVHVAYTEILASLGMYQSGRGRKVRSNCTTAPEVTYAQTNKKVAQQKRTVIILTAVVCLKYV